MENVKFTRLNDVSLSPTHQEENAGLEKKFWVNLGGVDYLYKIDGRHKYGFCELFYSHICHMLGLDCVNCYPAQDTKSKTKGVIVESYIKPDTMIVSLQTFFERVAQRGMKLTVCQDGGIYFTYEDFLEIMALVEKEDCYVIDQNFMSDIRKMLLIDFVFMNTDRHDTNIELYVKKHMIGEKEKYLVSLVPMFDHGRSLAILCDHETQLVTYGEIPLFVFEGKGTESGQPLIKRIAEETARLICNDNELKNLYQQLKKINIKDQLYYVSQMGGYKLPPKQIEFIAKLVEKRIDLLQLSIYKFSQDNQRESETIIGGDGYEY